jgi:hypothetical protein
VLPRFVYDTILNSVTRIKDRARAGIPTVSVWRVALGISASARRRVPPPCTPSCAVASSVQPPNLLQSYLCACLVRMPCDVGGETLAAPLFPRQPLDTKGTIYDFVLWTSWTVVLSLMAVSVGHLVTPFADGSGLPQMKAYLGGTDLKKFFGWRVMFGKLFGLFCGQAAGLPIGKEVSNSPYCRACIPCYLCEGLLHIW